MLTGWVEPTDGRPDAPRRPPNEQGPAQLPPQAPPGTIWKLRLAEPPVSIGPTARIGEDLSAFRGFPSPRPGGSPIIAWVSARARFEGTPPVGAMGSPRIRTTSSVSFRHSARRMDGQSRDLGASKPEFHPVLGGATVLSRDDRHSRRPKSRDHSSSFRTVRLSLASLISRYLCPSPGPSGRLGGDQVGHQRQWVVGGRQDGLLVVDGHAGRRTRRRWLPGSTR